MMSGRQVQDNEKRDLAGHNVLFQDDHQKLLLQNHY